MKSKTSRIILVIAVVAVIAAVFIGAAIHRSGDGDEETTNRGMYVADTDGSTYWTELGPEDADRSTGEVTWKAQTN